MTTKREHFPSNSVILSWKLPLEPEFLDEGSVRAPVGGLEVLQVLAAVCDEPQEPASRVLVLVIFVEMEGKFLDPTGQKRDLHLRRARISVVELGFRHFIGLSAFRQHRKTISY